MDVKTLKFNPSLKNEANLKYFESKARHWPKSPFPTTLALNDKVVLYHGQVQSIKADAIVNPTNENLTHLSFVQELAGPDLEHYIRKKVRICATGDVIMTPGFKSNYQNILHAVPPKFQPKYKTAAETALFHTYFRILETMVEKKLRTVVMPILATPKCNLPLQDNYNLQLRVIRRFLEKEGDHFDKIVVFIEQDTDDFLIPFLCYFPPSPIEEDIACHFFDSSIGGPNGEPIIPERQIRIKSKPAVVLDPSNQSIDLRSGLDLSTVVGKTNFSKMLDDTKIVVKKKSIQKCTLF